MHCVSASFNADNIFPNKIAIPFDTFPVCPSMPQLHAAIALIRMYFVFVLVCHFCGDSFVGRGMRLLVQPGNQLLLLSGCNPIILDSAKGRILKADFCCHMFLLFMTIFPSWYLFLLL